MTRENIFYRIVIGSAFGCFVLYFALVKPYVYGQNSRVEKTSIRQATAHSELTSTGANSKKEVRSVYSAATALAAAQNARLKNSLRWDFGGKRQIGWYLYVPLISHTVDTESFPDSPEFARAVSIWQGNSGLPSTGVIDRETLKTFIKVWQSQRLGRHVNSSPKHLLSAPISDFYDLTRNAELLRLDARAYSAYKRMIEAAAKDVSLKLRLTKAGELAPEEKFCRIVSAFRSREYQDQLRKKEPNAGRAQLAKNSPHLTGHALDIYVGGDPVSTKDPNRAIQVQTPVYKWLVKNAHRFGFYPYFYEPWHWEFVPGK